MARQRSSASTEAAPSAVQVTNQTLEIAALTAHPRNYNRHPDQQVERIAASLRKFGQPRSIVVHRGTILAGHGVVQAAKQLGWTEIRADVLPDDYPDHLALAYVAADNELSRQGDPDLAALAAIIDESRNADPELMQAIGYDDREFEKLLREVGRITGGTPQDAEPQIDRAEELRQKWGVRPGDLWGMGDHRLICGDCTDPAVVARVMGGELADLMWTDPPYGVSYADKNKFLNTMAKGHRIETEIRNDHGTVSESAEIWRSAFIEARKVSRPGAAYYVASPQGGELMMMMMMMIRDAGWAIKHTLIWVKNHFVLGRSDYHYKHEPILYGWNPGAGHTWIDDLPTNSVIDGDADIKRMSKDQLIDLVNDLRNADRLDVLRLDKPAVSDLHPTTKPTKLVRITMQNNTLAGDLVIDPFSGSGTTLIACEQLSRRARAVEISPAYVAVTLERYATATGRTPTLLERAP